MTKIEWIVSDLDGTLFFHREDTGGLDCDNETIASINAAIKKGINFSVATGRHYLDALNITKNKINYPSNSFIIGLNGSQIYSTKEKKLISSVAIDNKHKKFLDNVKDKMYKKYGSDLLFFVYSNNEEIFFIKNNMLNYNDLKKFVFSKESNESIFKYFDVSKIENCPSILKICILFINGVENFHEEIIDFLKSISNDYDYVVSSNWYVEILPKNVSKGNAIKYINEHFYNKFSNNQIMVFGDSGNDISMFKLSNLSITRSDTNDYVKKNAKFIYDGGASSFIKYAINDFILKPK